MIWKFKQLSYVETPIFFINPVKKLICWVKEKFRSKIIEYT